MIAIKDPPKEGRSENGKSSKILSATFSLSFEKASASSGDSSSVDIKKIKVTNLSQPIKINMTLDPAQMNNSLMYRCVYLEEKTGMLSDSGVISVINSSTGEC